MRTDRVGARFPAVAGAVAVLLQISYPLVHGEARDRVTVAIVLVFALASGAHAVVTRGWRRGLGIVGVSAMLGFGGDIVGLHTGFPFGSYAYAHSLGIELFGVPLVVAGAWVMLAWPAAVVGARLVGPVGGRVLVTAWALASWDLLLDPQMVADGHWRWRFASPHLPGVTHVPLTNYAGWLLVALVIAVAVTVMAGEIPTAHDGVAIGLYLWTWLGSTLALAAFLHLGAAAFWGCVGMGLVGVPLLRQLRPSGQRA